MADAIRLVDPRDAILAIWRRWATFHRKGELDWQDSRNERNCILDAEMLECLLYPSFTANSVDSGLSLGALETPPEYVREALNRGDSLHSDYLDEEIIRGIVGRLRDFLVHWGGHEPTFHPGSYLESSPDSGGLELAGEEFPPVVDAYTLSVSLCIHAKYLLGEWLERCGDNWENLASKVGLTLAELEELRRLLDLRLTAALVGLSRSFAVYSVKKSDWSAVRGQNWSEGEQLARVRRRLSRYFGSADSPSDPFECGWSWGETTIENSETLWFLAGVWSEARQQVADPPAGSSPASGDHVEWPAVDWLALRAPYLYFTVTAIDGISDLFSSKTRGSQLLTPSQASVASHLGFLWEMTWLYWRTVAFTTLPSGSWAIEEVPWQTADGSESPYWTALVLRIITAYPEGRAAVGAEEARVERLTGVIEELARQAGLIGTDRPDSQQIDLHRTGAVLALEPISSEDPVGAWRLLDLTPQILKITARLLQGTYDEGVRRRLIAISDACWRQMLVRRVGSKTIGGRDALAWDTLSSRSKKEDGEGDRGAETEADVSSWYITERVVEALIAVDASQALRLHRLDAAETACSQMLSDLRWLITTRIEIPETRSKLLRAVAEAEEVAQTSPALGFARITAIGEALNEQFAGAK